MLLRKIDNEPSFYARFCSKSALRLEPKSSKPHIETLKKAMLYMKVAKALDKA